MIQQHALDQLRLASRIDPLRDLWTANAILKNIEHGDLARLNPHDKADASKTLQELLVAALDLYQRMPCELRPPLGAKGGCSTPAPHTGT